MKNKITFTDSLEVLIWILRSSKRRKEANRIKKLNRKNFCAYARGGPGQLFDFFVDHRIWQKDMLINILISVFHGITSELTKADYLQANEIASLYSYPYLSVSRCMNCGYKSVLDYELFRLYLNIVITDAIVDGIQKSRLLKNIKKLWKNYNIKTKLMKLKKLALKHGIIYHKSDRYSIEAETKCFNCKSNNLKFYQLRYKNNDLFRTRVIY